MFNSFCYDRRFSYYDEQDQVAVSRLNQMRAAVQSELFDMYDRFSRIMRPTFADRTRRWGGWGLAKPKNAKPRRKDHRA